MMGSLAVQEILEAQDFLAHLEEQEHQVVLAELEALDLQELLVSLEEQDHPENVEAKDFLAHLEEQEAQDQQDSQDQLAQGVYREILELLVLQGTLDPQAHPVCQGPVEEMEYLVELEHLDSLAHLAKRVQQVL
jgi:hypothetical protein